MSKPFKDYHLANKNLCVADRVLIAIGVLCFSLSCITVFSDLDFTSPSLVVIRSVISSIFGYFFGAQISITGKSNKSKHQVQLYIAASLAIFSVIVTYLSIVLSINQSHPALVEIRNLLFSSTGYIISKVKSNDLEDQLEEYCEEEETKKKISNGNNDTFYGEGI